MRREREEEKKSFPRNVMIEETARDEKHERQKEKNKQK
jgi:hypothetical protein